MSCNTGVFVNGWEMENDQIGGEEMGGKKIYLQPPPSLSYSRTENDIS